MRVLEARLLDYDSNGTPINYKKIAGLSTETKPTTGVCTGSEFFEVDTGKTNYFEETNTEWIDPTAEPDNTEPAEPQENTGEAKVLTKTTTRKTSTK